MQTPWRYEGVRWKFRSVKNFPLQCIALLQAINYLKSLHTPLTKNCWLLTSQLAFEKDQFEVKGNNYFLNVKMRVRITFIILTTTPFRVNSWRRWWVKISLTLYLFELSSHKKPFPTSEQILLISSCLSSLSNILPSTTSTYFNFLHFQVFVLTFIKTEIMHLDIRMVLEILRQYFLILCKVFEFQM